MSMVSTLITMASVGIIGSLLEKVLVETGQGNIAEYIRIAKGASCAGLSVAEVFKLIQMLSSVVL